MKGYRLALVRHGITQANTEGRYIGITDVPLSQKGVMDLYKKTDKSEYPSVQKVYTSPLKRCTQTADILFPNRYTAELGLLAEMNFGDFEEKTAEELLENPAYKKFLEGGLDNPPPNGESARDVMNRCYEAMQIIISDMMYEGLTNCAVVTHGGIIMNMLSCFGVPKLKPADYQCDFGEGFEIIITADMWQRSGAFEILGRYPPKPEIFEQEDDYNYDFEDEE